MALVIKAAGCLLSLGDGHSCSAAAMASILQHSRCIVAADDDDCQCGRSIAQLVDAQPGTLRGDKFSIGEKEGDLERVIA